MQKPAKVTNCYIPYIFYRRVEAWNALSAVMKSTSSLPKVKQGLKNVELKLKFLKGSVSSL